VRKENFSHGEIIRITRRRRLNGTRITANGKSLMLIAATMLD
jgi:hypothetical protein